MNRISAILFCATVIITTACSDNVPLFRDLHKGRADVLDRLVITPGAVTLSEQAYVMLSATGYYNDGTSADLSDECEWTCDDQQVAVVSGAGYVQARALTGFANVSARHGDLRSTVAVTVDIRLASLTITPNTTVLRSTNQVYFAASGRTTDGTVMDLTKTVSWVVTPFTKAEVDGSGMFMARDTEGTVTVTAKSPDGSITSNAATVELDLTTLYVDAAFVTEAGNGTKEKPFATITQGIARAEQIGAVRINVAKGTYTEDVIIKKNISLYGGYVANYSGAEWTRAATVVPGETIIQAKGNTAVLYQSGLTAATVLDGFRIIGGNDAALSTSTGIMCVNASPTIQNNEIYGGRASLSSVGILNQTASPAIKNNAMISGGLPSYAGGGADNIAILCQSFSNPVIESNAITGPCGGESTYRIKCESSSNAKISGNTIETTSAANAGTGGGTVARGVLAISSSPMIEGNTIGSQTVGNLVIRGENTSFKITGNSIEGSIYITSGSINPVIASNIRIAGNITVTGVSTGVSIRDHYVATATGSTAHYGRLMQKVIEGGISFSGSANGTVTDNVLNHASFMDGASAVFLRNTLLVFDRYTGLTINGGAGRFERNLIIVEYLENEFAVIGVVCQNNTSAIYLSNNIIHAHNTSTTTIKGARGIYSTYNGLICVHNNLIHVVNDSSGVGSHAIGMYFSWYEDPNNVRLFNNIIIPRGSGILRGILNFGDNRPSLIQSNYFISSTPSAIQVFSHNGVVSNEAGDLNALVATYYDGNANATGVVPQWAAYTATRVGLAFADNNFNIGATSVLRNKAKDPDDFIGTQYMSAGAPYMNPDFADTVRTITTNAFSVGPYEYVP